MVNAAEPAILAAAVAEVGPAVRAVQPEQARPSLIVAEQHQVLAQVADGQRRAAHRQLLEQGDRQPVATEQLARGGAAIGLGEEVVGYGSRRHGYSPSPQPSPA